MTEPTQPSECQPFSACAPEHGRAILRVEGEDRVKFLQGQVTQDMARVLRDGIAYGAVLTPQGKLFADFLLVDDGDAILIDVAESLADALLQRLTMFRLRSRVTVSRADRPVTRGLGAMPDGALPDPRHAALGWRLYGLALTEGAPIDWEARRVAACVPETGVELQPNESYILELDFERLNGVDFRKGCYVGQEVTARMHHKTELRRRLMTVSVAG
ncbi:MAG: folate-binding protein, partial [Pararhodobacter sp.]|nr:folate-binding protein [Pararhodobacter sp.]